MTGKITDPKQYRSKAEIAAEKKAKAKLEKQKIRDELLAPEPISDQDTKIFSGYLAAQSGNSKSELQIQEEKEKEEKTKKEKEEADKKRLAEIKAENERMKKQLEEEENAQIK